MFRHWDDLGGVSLQGAAPHRILRVKADPSKTYLISISGGKDSTALWLHLKNELRLPNLIAIFSDTGWEHPATYDYLDYLETVIGPLIRLKPELDFVELAKKKNRFPSAKARFCTEHLKMRPMREWLRSQIDTRALSSDDLIQCTGIRAEESSSRAKMSEFVEMDEFFKLPQWRPIISWTWQEVFDCHERHQVAPNPLYKQGMSRVGCMPCIMSNHSELAEIAVRFPETIYKVEAAEAYASSPARPSSFFGPGFIPERFCSTEWQHPKTGVIYKIPTARDVFNYVQLSKPEKEFGGKMVPLFTEPPNESIGVCSSIYGLCE